MAAQFRQMQKLLRNLATTQGLAPEIQATLRNVLGVFAPTAAAAIPLLQQQAAFQCPAWPGARLDSATSPVKVASLIAITAPLIAVAGLCCDSLSCAAATLSQSLSSGFCCQSTTFTSSGSPSSNDVSSHSTGGATPEEISTCQQRMLP